MALADMVAVFFIFFYHKEFITVFKLKLSSNAKLISK